MIDAPVRDDAAHASMPPTAAPAGEPAHAERLLQGLCAGERELNELAASLEVSLGELAALVAAPAHAALLERMLRLINVRTALALGRYRSIAAAVLVRIATQKDEDDQHSDLSRKACVDLLNAESPVHIGDNRTNAGDQGASSLAPPPVASEQAILRAFERLEQQEAHALDSLARSRDSESASCANHPQREGV